jgi:hypothetical protein
VEVETCTSLVKGRNRPWEREETWAFYASTSGLPYDEMGDRDTCWLGQNFHFSAKPPHPPECFDNLADTSEEGARVGFDVGAYVEGTHFCEGSALSLYFHRSFSFHVSD